MTCPICTHAARADIERAIRAQQDASRRGQATSAASYSQTARTYGLSKQVVHEHRDRCMARRGGARARAEIAEPGTGPPTECTNDTKPDVCAGAGESGEVEGGSSAAAPASAPKVSNEHEPRARARNHNVRQQPWSHRAQQHVDNVARNLANTTADFALRDASVRTHASYVHEIAIQIQADKWNGYESVTAKMREWSRDQLYVQLVHRDACSMLRVARGTIEDQREESLARWMSFYRLCVENGSDVALKVAGDALKGYDLAAGIVDKSTRVQVNVMTDPQAQAMLRAVFDVVREDPAMLERLRARLLELPGAAAGLPSVHVVDVEK